MTQEEKKEEKTYFKGKEEELGGTIFGYGHKAQAELYNRAIIDIAEFAGKKYSKEMRLVIKNSKEYKPKEPDPPKLEQGGKMDDIEVMKYKSKLDRYEKKLEMYDDHKAKVFLMLMGQCTMTMKDKVEHNEEFKKAEEDYDVVKLLSIIKKISYGDVKAKYKYWTMAKDMRRLFGMQQHQNESIIAYHRRFLNLVQVIEAKWGQLVPEKMAQQETSYSRSKQKTLDESRDKFLACLFIDGTYKSKYSKCVDELTNSYLTNNNKYPKNLEEALNYVSDFQDNSNGDAKDGISFAQTKKVICYLCGEEGHTVPKCPYRQKKEGVQAWQEEGKVLELPNAGFAQRTGNRFMQAQMEAEAKKK